MRDTDRIAPFLMEIGIEWEKVPDLRFGQLMFNFFRSLPSDPFYWEEDKFLEEFKKFIAKNK